MAKLTDFLLELLNDPPSQTDKRVKFFGDPFASLDAFAAAHGALSPEQKAILFAMDRGAILEYCTAEGADAAFRKKLLSYNFEDHDWKPGNKWENPASCSHVAGPAAEAAAMHAGAGGAGGGWTAPTQQITRVHPAKGSRSNPSVPITVVGEGLLKSAKVILSNPFNVKYVGYAEATLSLCHVANFRRTYLKGTLDLTAIEQDNHGQYELRVLNEGSRKPILWRSRYIVEP